jgi:8-oxo-dGTP pyrophosphatase MutT (NUDIX family)
MVDDESFGVIPLKKEGESWRVFLIRHRKGRYWGFPKGHAEQGESPLQAASRELREETALEISHLLQQMPFVEAYQFHIEGKKVRKRVSYFVAEVSGEIKLQQKEIGDGKWMELKAALNQVTHPEGKAILRQVIEQLC